MKIGVPAEVKADEYRVAMLPVGVETLVAAGHQVVVQSGAGHGSGLEDAAYREAGAELADTAAEVYEAAELIVKVKEPLPQEWPLIREGTAIFAYFHFAADRQLIAAMLERKVSCFAYETLRDAQGRLPLLTPMSEVAGRMSIQAGAKFLERPQQGRGVLLSGVPGVQPAHVTILGGGVVGASAAKIAAGFGASVSILDVNLDRLRYLDDTMPANVTVLFSDRHMIREQLAIADLVIGAVLIPGAKAPHLVLAEDLKRMYAGSVMIDVAIDQGGCFETSRPTTHREPTFVVDDVVHYCVTNMPGIVPRTSTQALNNATLPYVLALADHGLREALRLDPDLANGVNVHAGRITHAAVAGALGLEHAPL